ncbi:hypothetical protein Tsubulata_035727 [Turnera subulata]|uniref:Gamma-tubulin complex component n=1 Tax=Turnera subulata TaxID=218843 RepID=A0A9Q0FLY6_9ROSI|nr:hypothetical protein Tsubulata_035727 [Turnera subulata]
MAVEANFASSLFEKLKGEDPWLPPTTWESIPIPQTTPRPITSPPPPPPPPPRLLTASVSEASLVRLALNSLQGVESAILSIEKLSASFCSVSADRTFHRNPSLWNRSSSTHALGRILTSVARSGSLVFLLRKFVEKFKDVEFDAADGGSSGHSLVNQAFAVAVDKVMEGYICGLDTVSASVGLRRCSSSSEEVEAGCFGSVGSCEVTFLELYLHTKELRTRVESLGNVCKLCDIANCFGAGCSFEELVSKAKLEFDKFYRGGDLLSYLYTQLQVADPAHRALLKFLFIRSSEPYCEFIRSWIFKAEISDPFKEFVVEYADSKAPHLHPKAGAPVDFTMAGVKEGVAVPCFLKDLLVPIVRAGQQLQVLKKLFELCNFVGPADYSFDDLLPCWSEYSGDHLLSTSPIAFSKGYLQTLVIARSNYYINKQKGLEKLVTKLEFRYPQAVPARDFAMVFDDHGKNLQSATLCTLDDRDVRSTESDGSEPKSEYEIFDASQSSDCSSWSDYEEQTEAEQLIGQPNSSMEHEEMYLSSLRFSLTSSSDNTMKKPVRESLPAAKGNLNGDCEMNNAFDHFVPSYNTKMMTTHINLPLGMGESKLSMSDTQDMDLKSTCSRLGFPNDPFCYDRGYCLFQGLDQSNSAQEMRKTTVPFLNKGLPYLSKMLYTSNALIEKTFGGDRLENETCSPMCSLQQGKENILLSTNPMLRRSTIFHASNPGKKCCRSYGKSLRCFDFSTVEDPCKEFEQLLADSSSHQTGSQVGSYAATPATSCKSYGKGNKSGNDASIRNDGPSCTNSSSYLKEHSQKVDGLTDYGGGSSWESILGSFSYAESRSVGDHRTILSSMVDIPLDFVLDKCLVQEILLQYKYVSKLAIKLLEEGFDLQEHLLALRRYYFMESADWADLFIMSLWHHNWSVAEADQRVSEIQGLLELAVQRSSCEWDPNKDRLFVFIKGNDDMPLPVSTVGVHSFDFLGLGYRVDWPVNIVLTPRALKIYVEIFSFLIRVKLAVFSLTDIWCSLKDLMPLINEYRRSKMHERELVHFNILIKMRHQVSHFISTLQQYVQSQLSHESWCKFLYSLKYKVKDMMDLELVHMAYLEDSLHICFLSDETRPVASIIESILQCAFEFRSCVTSRLWDAEPDQEGLPCKLSGTKISQVLSIKKKFDKSLKELHLCYLKSPKHGGFGLSRFWGYLNYNEYYSDIGSQMGLSAFPF